MFPERPQIYGHCVSLVAILCPIVGVMFLVAADACAQSSCVTCTGPDSTYYCTAQSSEEIPEKTAGLFCAARIAEAYGHQSCATRRDVPACDGVAVSFAYEQQATPGLNAQRWDDPAKARKPEEEPQTLGEFAQDTAEASGEAVKNAGETIGDAAKTAGKATTDAIKGAGKAIGDATKKTLKCLGSALNDC